MSGEFKGTPGPWHVMRGDVLDKNGRMVASIEGFCPGEAEIYDAQLISVAPEMLEHLHKIVLYCESAEYRGAMTARQMATFMDGIRAECLPIIAKALGGTQ